MAKCIYMRCECLMEAKGKCGKAANCPYAKELMKANKAKNLDTYYKKWLKKNGHKVISS